MLPPEKPSNEIERLHALRALDILDTSSEERFDRVTRMAKQMFNVPIAVVSLVDDERQWFKSIKGLDETELPRSISFCGHTINQDDVFMVPNTLEDIRFFDNPLVTGETHVRFYAGYSIKLRPGINLGTLCLIDVKPRMLSHQEISLLRDFGAMIEQEIKSTQWATFDELTMISSRRGFLILAEHAQKVCLRRDVSMAFVLIDLDDFKPINDVYGHHEGDEALIQFADVMRNTFRESDIIGRLGGDEFVVMMSGATEQEIYTVLERFEKAVAEMNKRMNKPYNICFSAGVACFSGAFSKSLEEMIEAADFDMYKQKKSKKILE